MKRIFLIDFDGTITIEDTCLVMVEKFCHPGWEVFNDQWEEGKLGTIECARATLSLFNVSLAELKEYLQTIRIDPGFRDFVHLVKQKGDSITILSDGYDFNIQTILKHNGLDDIPFYANRLLYVNGRYDIECPYHNDDCGNCGTCKKNLLQQLRKDGAQTVYIGDGTSDKCVANYADVVFAKSGLFKYCQEQGLRAMEFRTFS